MMDCSLFLITNEIPDIEGVRDSIFKVPYSVIISDSCYYVGTYVGVLIKFCFPRIFK